MKTFSRLWQYLVEFFLEWEMFQIKVVNKIKTHILCSITFFRISSRLWDNVEKLMKPGRTQMAIQRRVACWVSKATCAQAHASARAPTPTRTHSYKDTHKRVILIAFPWQQWFRQRASILRYTFIDCFVYYYTFQSSRAIFWYKKKL
jgi:hypothetical protein